MYLGRNIKINRNISATFTALLSLLSTHKQRMRPSVLLADSDCTAYRKFKYFLLNTFTINNIFKYSNLILDYDDRNKQKIWLTFSYSRYFIHSWLKGWPTCHLKYWLVGCLVLGDVWAVLLIKYLICQLTTHTFFAARPGSPVNSNIYKLGLNAHWLQARDLELFKPFFKK